MTIELRSRPFELTPALGGHVERRLRFALGRFGGRVEAVRVRVEDQNGPRGGVDKTCRLRARLRGAAPVGVDEADVDLYVAVDRAASRLARGVARAIERRETRRRWRAAND
jgi:ribosomal subunit interface protein